jgi:hypothetical protein
MLHVQSKMMVRQLHTMLSVPRTLGPSTKLFEDGRVQFGSKLFIGEVRTKRYFGRYAISKAKRNMQIEH